MVRREDREALDNYLVKRAMQCYWVDEKVVLTYEEEIAVRGLLYTKAVVFHPDDVAKAGVRLSKVEQVRGTVVIGDGDLVHFGTATASDQPHSVNEAINFIPVQWLTTGLPRLVTWMRWLRDTWLPMQQSDAMPEGSKVNLRIAIQDARTNYLMALHCSPLWCEEFLARLRTLIAKPTRDPKKVAIREAIITQLKDSAGIENSLEKLDEVLSMMTKDVKLRQWLLKHSAGTEDEKPKKGYF